MSRSLETNLLAFGALGRKELLVTSDAVIVFVLGNEALSPQSFLAVVASEAVFVPLLPLVFHLLGAWWRRRRRRRRSFHMSMRRG